ncbi:tRNA lysidine(34) synthetase TilS [Hansschlegelia zhihuaiae]|uniref:tRNA(Ile)-lysidine synthase n=1 Tax=Hansschlegelia zhihuaiae TaxID=405005 RepID=A0A4Q0MIL2_9HYPH|nr:tRNA lysidine(34) synthetase TilS [Hansschlegelia zhihuaiae]RXF73497.1 tRNA lysidine(34) synthetase TilS [Hansschlegelia zhihuaiae]
MSQDDVEDESQTSEAQRSDAIGGVESALLFERAFPRQERIVLAVSGGADSTALLVLAAEWAQGRGGPSLFVATVDHGLRPQAAQEAEAVAALAASYGLPHARLDAPLTGGATRIEETARRLRYAALANHAKEIGADALATAHTLDDQAETVLMRLAAGSGPSGLAAIRQEVSRDGVVTIRPFLGVPKRRLVETLRARKIGWAEDAMNADLRFARPRLRASREALEREGLTAERLAVFAFRMLRVNAALDQAVDAAFGAHVRAEGATLRIEPTAYGLADEIKLRLLRTVIEKVGDARARLDRLERLADRIVTKPSGVGTLAGARVEWTSDGAISVSPAPPRRARGAHGHGPL